MIRAVGMPADSGRRSTEAGITLIRMDTGPDKAYDTFWIIHVNFMMVKQVKKIAYGTL